MVHRLATHTTPPATRGIRRHLSLVASTAACVAVMGLTGCAGMSHHTRDTAIGAGVGAVAGSVLTGSTAGTVAGAVIGGVIGHENRKK